MEHMSREKQVIFAEMLMDLKGEKRILIPYCIDIDCLQICCDCLAATSGRGITVQLNQKPPKSMSRKVGGFALDAVLYNLSPTAFFVTRVMGNSSKAFLLNGFVHSKIKLPYCSECIHRKTRTGTSIDVIQIWPRKTVEAGSATVKAGYSWFEIFYDNPDFAEKLIELNPEMVFTSWIDMSNYVPEDSLEKEEISGGYNAWGKARLDDEPTDNGPINPAKMFASLVKGSNTFPAIAIPEKKLNNAMASFASLGPDEKVVGLHDYTVMGSGKKGVVFTDLGIYWNSGKNKGHIRYEDIDPNEILCTRIESTTAVVVASDKWLPFTVIRVKDLEWVVEYLKRVC